MSRCRRRLQNKAINSTRPEESRGGNLNWMMARLCLECMSVTESQSLIPYIWRSSVIRSDLLSSAVALRSDETIWKSTCLLHIMSEKLNLHLTWSFPPCKCFPTSEIKFCLRLSVRCGAAAHLP